MVNTLSLINKKSAENPQGFIFACEERFDSAVNAVVSSFLSKPAYDIVLLAGPSSSGKTTTAGILAQKIRSSGKNAFIVSLPPLHPALLPPDNSVSAGYPCGYSSVHRQQKQKQ